MSGLVRFLYLLALAVWVGEIVFFSFVVAPAVFRVLDPPRAGAVVGEIFPRYYALGTVAGAVALACALVLARRASATGWWTGAVVALGLGLAATLWAGRVVHPRAHPFGQGVGLHPFRPVARAEHRQPDAREVPSEESERPEGVAPTVDRRGVVGHCQQRPARGSDGREVLRRQTGLQLRPEKSRMDRDQRRGKVRLA